MIWGPLYVTEPTGEENSLELGGTGFGLFGFPPARERRETISLHPLRERRTRST